MPSTLEARRALSAVQTSPSFQSGASSPAQWEPRPHPRSVPAPLAPSVHPCLCPPVPDTCHPWSPTACAWLIAWRSVRVAAGVCSHPLSPEWPDRVLLLRGPVARCGGSRPWVAVYTRVQVFGSVVCVSGAGCWVTRWFQVQLFEEPAKLLFPVSPELPRGLRSFHVLASPCCSSFDSGHRAGRWRPLWF